MGAPPTYLAIFSSFKQNNLILHFDRKHNSPSRIDVVVANAYFSADAPLQLFNLSTEHWYTLVLSITFHNSTPT